MNEKLKDKKTLLIVGLFLVLVTLVGVSYAFFSAVIKGNDTAGENVFAAGTMKLTFVDDNAISLPNAKPGDTDSKTFIVENTGTLDDLYTYNIKLTELNVTFKGQDLTYNLVEYTDDTYETEKEGGIKKEGVINIGTVNGNKEMYLATNITRPEKTKKHYYKLTITFENLDKPQDYNQEAEFGGKINVDTDEAKIEEYIASYSDYCVGAEDLASCMLEFANRFEDFVATDDPDANARFMGADPNNYVYFNCEDYDNPSVDTCELWRIIGSFNDIELAGSGTKNLVKIIRAEDLAKDSEIIAWTETIGEDTSIFHGLSYDYRETETLPPSSIKNYSNDWTQSSLMKTLNEGYDSFEMNGNGQKVSNSLYWNRQKGICWSTKEIKNKNNENPDIFEPTVECDFTKTGLTKNTYSMIENVKWHIGGIDTSIIKTANASTWYQKERGNDSYNSQPTTWNGNIALIYPSDYAYSTSGGATTRQVCLNKALFEWNNLWDRGNSDLPECYNNNWLLDEENYPLTLTSRIATDAPTIMRINQTGGISWNIAASGRAIRPSLYLKSNVELVSGTGTKSNPYVIKSM